MANEDWDITDIQSPSFRFGEEHDTERLFGPISKTPSTWETVAGPEQHWSEDALLAHGSYSGADVEGYTIDQELSDDSSTLYINNQTKKVTVAFAGTNDQSIHDTAEARKQHFYGDLIADANIFGGAEEQSMDFHKAEHRVKQAIAKYGKENVHLTGHSLGGTKALYTSSLTGLKANAFNPGFSPMDILAHSTKLFGRKWDYSKAQAFIVPGDPVSTSAYLQPGLKINTELENDQYKHIVEGFAKSKTRDAALEAGAGASMKQILSNVNPWVKAAVVAGTIGKALAPLHDSGNFTDHRRQHMPVTPVPNAAFIPKRDRRHGGRGARK